MLEMHHWPKVWVGVGHRTLGEACPIQHEVFPVPFIRG